MKKKNFIGLLFLIAVCQSVMGIHVQVKFADDSETGGDISVMPLYEGSSAEYSPLYARHILEYNTGTFNRLRALVVKEARNDGQEALSRLNFDQVELRGTGSVTIEIFPDRNGLYKARCFGSTDVLFKSLTKVNFDVDPEVVIGDEDWSLV